MLWHAAVSRHAPITRIRAQSFEIGPIGRWRTISAFVRELAASSPEANRELFERLVLGLTEPVRRFDELAALGERSVAGDWHARCELRRKVGEIVATVPAVRGAVKRLATVSDHECGCGDALVAEQTGQGASVVDEEALAALAFVVAASFGSDSPEARAEAEPLPCFSGRGTGRERCFAR